MKRYGFRRLISVFLSLALFLPFFAADGLFSARAAGEPLKVLDWETVRAHYSLDGASSLELQEITSDLAAGVPYFRIKVTKFNASNSGSSAKFALDGRQLPFGTSIEQGDWVLIRLILRNAPTSVSEEAIVRPALFNYDNNLTTTLAPESRVSSAWTELSIPVRANHSGGIEPDSLLIRLAFQLQTLDIAWMEATNYQTTSCASLAGTRILTDREVKEAVLGEKLALSWEDYYSGCTQSGTANSSLSRPAGLAFPRLDVSVNTVVLQDNGSANMTRSMTVLNDAFSGTFAQGDWALFRLIVRTAPDSPEETGRVQFRLYNGSKTVHQVPSFTFGSVWTEVIVPYQLTSADTPTIKRMDLAEGFLVQKIQIAYLEVLNFGSEDPSAYRATNLLPDLKTEAEEWSKENAMEFDFTSLFQGTAAGDGKFSGAVSLSGSQTVLLPDGAKEAAAAGRMTLYSFAVKAREVCTPLTITIDGTVSEKWYVPAGWCRIYAAIASFSAESVSFSYEGDLLLGEAKIADRGEMTFDELYDEGGMWLLEDFEETELPQTGAGVGSVRGMVQSGNYLYTIGDGTLSVVDVSVPGDERVLSTLGGMGANIRQIDLCHTGEDVIITSREARAYIVNVSDPLHPYIRSHCDTLEMATGVCTYGTYALIANRQYGVEVIDLSDLDSPRHLANIPSGEAQSCCVSNGILYAGLWGECRVDLYDIADPAHSVFLGSCPLSGKGDGVFTEVVNGRTILFAATGQHSMPGVANTDNSVLSFGNGNGLDIFDVTDPASPVWLSSTHIDGRYYFANYDYWKVSVAEANGRLLAYLVNTFNGVYILDVTNLRAPVRLEHITVKLDTVTPNVFAGRHSIFPYDQYARSQSPVGSVAVRPGALYLGGVLSDLHCVLSDRTGEQHRLSQDVPVSCGTDYYDQDLSVLGEEAARFDPDGQVYAVTEYNGKYYVACGADGIWILDRDLNVLSRFVTEDLAEDIQIRDGFAYVAESMTGLNIYELSADGLSFTLRRNYRETNRPVTQVRLSSTGKFIALQVGASGVSILRASDLVRLHSKGGNRLSYHHNLLPVMLQDRYFVFWADGTGSVQCFDCGENDSFDTPVWISSDNASYSFDQSGLVMQSGMSVLNGKLLIVGRGRYRLLDPAAQSASNLSSLPWTSISGETGVTGKPMVFGDLLVLSNRFSGDFYLVDVSDPASPVCLRHLSFKGNPDLALLSDGCLLVPMSYQGLVRIPLTDEECSLAGVLPSSKRLRVAGRTLIFDSTFSARYLLEKDVFDGYLAAGMTVDSFTVTVNEKTTDLSSVIGSGQVILLEGKEYYWVKVNGISPKDAATPVSFSLVCTLNGETYTDLYEDSVKAALSQEANGNGAFADAANAALAYCAAAARKFGKDDSAFNFDAVTPVTSYTEITTYKEGAGVIDLCGTSLILKDELAICFLAHPGAFTGTLDSITVKVNGVEKNAEKAVNGKYFTFKIAVPIREMKTEMSVELFVNGQSVSNRYVDSVLNYAVCCASEAYGFGAEDRALGQAVIDYLHYANEYLDTLS